VLEVLRQLKPSVEPALMQRACLRTGVAFLQLEENYGALILNGRDLVHVPPFRSTSSRLDSAARFEKLTTRFNIVQSFIGLAVDEWRLVSP
jgi:hypothetical protein